MLLLPSQLSSSCSEQPFIYTTGSFSPQSFFSPSFISNSCLVFPAAGRKKNNTHTKKSTILDRQSPARLVESSWQSFSLGFLEPTCPWFDHQRSETSSKEEVHSCGINIYICAYIYRQDTQEATQSSQHSFPESHPAEGKVVKSRARGKNQTKAITILWHTSATVKCPMAWLARL